jgi:prephenate dehydratase
MKVAFQGEAGAYSEEAVIQHWGEKASPVPRPYLRDVFNSVESGEADLGLVPVENTLEGSIVRTYDLLLEKDLRVTGEAVLRVVHCLIANPNVTLQEVKRVYSHPQALGQCRAYLEDNNYEPVAAYDTAGSVKMIKEKGLMDAAAIASARAAKVYEMSILRQGIETHEENFTRFLVIGGKNNPPSQRDKTSLAFNVEHKPGTLYNALKVFKDNGVNLTKIESRPLLGKPWEYVFFLDFMGNETEPKVAETLEQFARETSFVKVFGSYPSAKSQVWQ